MPTDLVPFLIKPGVPSARGSAPRDPGEVLLLTRDERRELRQSYRSLRRLGTQAHVLRDAMSLGRYTARASKRNEARAAVGTVSVLADPSC